MAAVLVTAAVGTLGQAGPPRPEGAELTLVAPQDQDAALQTIASDQRAQVAQDLAGCKIGLTRMSVGPMPGATASGYVQIRAGSYLSPIFQLSNATIDLAVPVPLPSPAAAGYIEGNVEILGNAKSLRVEMTPPHDYPSLSTSQTERVYWETSPACAVKKG